MQNLAAQRGKQVAKVGPKRDALGRFVAKPKAKPTIQNIPRLKNDLFLKPPVRPTAAKPKAVATKPGLLAKAASGVRARLGVPEDGTLEAFVNNPELYRGKAIRFTGYPQQLDPKWGYIGIPPKGEYVIHTATKNANGTALVVAQPTDRNKYGGLYQNIPLGTKIEIVDETKLPLRDKLDRQTSVYNHAIVGSDPEVFVTRGDGTLIPAFDFLPAAKKGETAPFWDGYQAEFGTQPYGCMSFFVDEIQQKLKATLDAAKKIDPKAKLSVKTVFDIPPERLANDDEKFVQFGCTPSLSVYGEKFPKVNSRNIPFRSAGGHLHLNTEGGAKRKPAIVKELDRILGVICTSMFAYYDDPRRRMLYGKAGEYRETRYGLEYRTLSNAWMVHPGLTHLTFMLARKCIALAEVGGFKDWTITEDQAREVINNADAEGARRLLGENMEPLRSLIRSVTHVDGDRGTDRWVNIIMQGADKFLKDPDKHSHMWKLDGGWVGHSEGRCANVYHTSRFMSDNGNNKLD